MDKNKGSFLGFLGFLGAITVGVFLGRLITAPPGYFLGTGLSYLVVILGMATLAFLITKVVDYLKLKATVSEDKGLEPDELRERLAAVEQRLTEVQDVMIALSEKIDHLDEVGSKSWERQEPREQG